MNILFLFLLLAFFMAGCGNGKDQQINSGDSNQSLVVNFDLDSILQRGKIVAALENSSTGFFIYRGKSEGFQFELLQYLAGYLNVELEIKVTSDIDQAFEWLNNGTVDIVAFPLTITKERKRKYRMSDNQYVVRQVLVQRKPEKWREMRIHEIERELIRNQVDLIGKKVHIRNKTSFKETLVNLSENIGGDIIIVEEPPGLETEDIIQMVSGGEIPRAIADEDIATILSNLYPNIDVNTPVSFPTQIGWAMRQTATHLGDTVDIWLNKMKRQPTFNVIYRKYFQDRAPVRMANVEMGEFDVSTISEYDKYILHAADTLGWDWRLLAAQIFKESRFNPMAKSWAGAVGLMQVLPTTAESYGITNLYNPKWNIEAGTRHLLWLMDQWGNEIEDETTRKRFILASYNVGLGHVRDAQRLAEKYGEDKEDWEVIEKYLLLKKKPKYFNDPVVVYGYCRGNEPVNYVKDIYSIFQRYKEVFPDADSLRMVQEEALETD